MKIINKCVLFMVIFGWLHLFSMEKVTQPPAMTLVEASAEQVAKDIYGGLKKIEIVKARLPEGSYENVNKYYFLLYGKVLDPNIELSFSIDDLLRYKRLIGKEQPTREGLKLILSNNQITKLEGLENIEEIEKFSRIDLS